MFSGIFVFIPSLGLNIFFDESKHFIVDRGVVVFGTVNDAVVITATTFYK
jgi:hypothetical protein